MEHLKVKREISHVVNCVNILVYEVGMSTPWMREGVEV